MSKIVIFTALLLCATLAFGAGGYSRSYYRQHGGHKSYLGGYHHYRPGYYHAVAKPVYHAPIHAKPVYHAPIHAKPVYHAPVVSHYKPAPHKVAYHAQPLKPLYHAAAAPHHSYYYKKPALHHGYYGPSYHHGGKYGHY